MKRTVLTLAFTLLCATAAAAQGETCSPFVVSALDHVGTACADMTRNTACYGNISLSAEAQADATNFQFAGVGDRVDLNALKSITTSPLDEKGDVWGVAMLSVQANLPDSIPGQNVTMMVYGDTSLEPQIAVLLDVSSGQTINIRKTPSTQGQIVGKLTAKTTLQADGRTDDSQWVRLRLEDGSVGWVNTKVSTVTGDIASLPVKAADDTAVSGSGQGAFYFKPGVGNSACAEVPDGGLILQSPDGTEVELVINNVDIQIGSTIAVTLVDSVANAPDGAAAGPYLAFHTLEGAISGVSIVGKTPISLSVPAGLVMYVPVDANLLPTDAAPFVVPYADDTIKIFTPFMAALSIPVTVAAPISGDALNEVVYRQVPLPGYWNAVITENTPDKTCGCSLVGPVDYQTVGQIAVSEDRQTVTLSGGQPSFYSSFTQTAPGIYEDKTVTHGSYKLIITSPREMLFQIEDTGQITWDLTYEGTEATTMQPGPLTPGEWAYTVTEFTETCNSIFGLKLSVGQPFPDNYHFGVTPNGDPLGFGGYVMSPGQNEGDYVFGQGFDIHTLHVESPTHVIISDSSGKPACQYTVDGTLVKATLAVRVKSFAPVDATIIPLSGTWTQTITAYEELDACKNTGKKVGDQSVVRITVSEDGQQLAFSTVFFLVRQPNGYYVWDNQTTEVINALAPDHLHAMYEQIGCQRAEFDFTLNR